MKMDLVGLGGLGGFGWNCVQIGCIELQAYGTVVPLEVPDSKAVKSCLNHMLISCLNHV